MSTHHNKTQRKRTCCVWGCAVIRFRIYFLHRFYVPNLPRAVFGGRIFPHTHTYIQDAGKTDQISRSAVYCVYTPSLCALTNESHIETPASENSSKRCVFSAAFWISWNSKMWCALEWDESKHMCSAWSQIILLVDGFRLRGNVRQAHIIYMAKNHINDWMGWFSADETERWTGQFYATFVWEFDRYLVVGITIVCIHLKYAH